MSRITRDPPSLLLGGALVAAGALLLVLVWEMTFIGDTWEFLMNRRGITAAALLKPHNEHIVLIPVAIEQLLLRLFGMTTALPERFVLTAALLAVALLLFIYMRRRVGAWLALFAAVLLLFLGPAWEVLLWPFEIGFAGAVLFGLAMLLALDREDSRGDLAACVCLVLSMGFSSLGISFAVAAAVDVLQRRGSRGLRRAYLVLVPVVLYAAWYVGWGHDAETHITLRNVLVSPRFVVEAIAASLGSLFGLGTSPTVGATDPVWGRSLFIVLVVGLIYRQLRKPGFFPGLWPVAAAAAVNWFLTAFNQMPGREPAASRYQYAGAIFILLLLANLLQGVRIGRRAVMVGVVITGLAVGPNLAVLKDGKNWLEEQSILARADTGAIEIARRTVSPPFQLTEEVAGTPILVDVTAAKYLTAIDEYGSPAYSPAELKSAPEVGRRQADVVLFHALPISTVTRFGAYAPDSSAENCAILPVGASSPASEVRLSPGLTRIELAPGPPAGFSLRRFAVDEYPVVVSEGAPGDSVTVLRIPRDLAPEPWYLHVEATQRLRACR